MQYANAGSKVTVKLNGIEQDLTIVDPESIDPNSGCISFNSPIAQALIGTEPGDTREIDLPNGNHVSLEIVSVI
ncbi:MAG: GreA/GreB family elongation factor [Patescibacteria group bacterium]